MSLFATTQPVPASRSKVCKRQVMAALWALLAGVMVFALAVPLRADCMRDREGRVICDRGQCVRDSHGRVYCSRYEDGAALRTRYGEVVCAKGDCVTTRKGDIICSARSGGATMKDCYGEVTCEGGCERASLSLCGERSPSR